MAEPTRSLEVVKEDDDKDTRLILVGEGCRANEELQTAAKEIDAEVFESETGLEHLVDAEEYDVVFVLPDFQGETFQNLLRSEARIVGPPVIIKAAKEKQHIAYSSRPLYCTSMLGLKVCFTGFKEKEELCRLVDLVHYMSGNVRKDFKCNVTHLVANTIGGEKYHYAVGVGRPVMNRDWVNRVWTERDNLPFRADDQDVMKYKLPPFYKQCLSFYGFSLEEQNHMEEVTIENGGTFSAVGDPECTHLVVDEAVKELPLDIHLPKQIVKGEWFWSCIQTDMCADEKMYQFQKASKAIVNCTTIFQAEPVNNYFTPTANMSGTRARKRKRLKDNIAQLASDEELESPLYSKRRSSELGNIISPNSFLDASNTPDLSESHHEKDNRGSRRLQVVKEFLQTEKNYVGILHTILYTFKSQIEKYDQYNGPILAAPDVKRIFGNIPAIYEIHCQMRDELADIVDNWEEDRLVGDVINKNAEALLKAYPPFVNFFEDTKDRIVKCDKTNQRFHAFLKVCQTKPECGRQTLAELLIRPVQRLPSIMLLVNDILKQTNKGTQDYTLLEKALASLKEVMTHINEDKRKTESQVVMFDIMNDIENCPATLLSSHRMFMSRLDVLELSDTLCGRGTPLSLFLFSDCVVFCKRRLKVLSSKSPSSLKTPQKGFKHVEMLNVQCVKRVLDVLDSDECRDSFGLITKVEMKEKLMTFMLDGDDGHKGEFLTSVCKSIANTWCRTDYETYLKTVEGVQLQITTTDLGYNTMSKAARFGKRVSRAFSFNKTPRRIKRAVSHVFSPFVKDSGRDFTPGDLRGKRLASSVDLTEDTVSLASFYDDSDAISLGTFSLKDC